MTNSTGTDRSTRVQQATALQSAIERRDAAIRRASKTDHAIVEKIEELERGYRAERARLGEAQAAASATMASLNHDVETLERDFRASADPRIALLSQNLGTHWEWVRTHRNAADCRDVMVATTRAQEKLAALAMDPAQEGVELEQALQAILDETGINPVELRLAVRRYRGETLVWLPGDKPALAGRS